MAHTTIVRRTIELVINRILEESGRPRRDFHDDDTLTGTIGLDSLDLAATVVQLEQDFGIDPFREGAQAVRTFRDLVTTYETALGGPST